MVNRQGIIERFRKLSLARIFLQTVCKVQQIDQFVIGFNNVEIFILSGNRGMDTLGLTNSEVVRLETLTVSWLALMFGL